MHGGPGPARSVAPVLGPPASLAPACSATNGMPVGLRPVPDPYLPSPSTGSCMNYEVPSPSPSLTPAEDGALRQAMQQRLGKATAADLAAAEGPEYTKVTSPAPHARVTPYESSVPSPTPAPASHRGPDGLCLEDRVALTRNSLRPFRGAAGSHRPPGLSEGGPPQPGHLSTVIQDDDDDDFLDAPTDGVS